MTTKTITNGFQVGGDYFKLIYSRKSTKSLDFYIEQFNPDDYWIYKTTNKQRRVTIEELKDFKYSGYTLFKKSLYDKEHIDCWIKMFQEFGRYTRSGGIQYLSKPLPPFKPEDKIKIKK